MKNLLVYGKFVSAASILILAGCAPMTFEQQQAMHAAVQESLRSNSDQLERQQQQIENNRQQNLQQIRQQRGMNCTHRADGDTIYSNCQ